MRIKWKFTKLRSSIHSWTRWNGWKLNKGNWWVQIPLWYVFKQQRSGWNVLLWIWHNSSHERIWLRFMCPETLRDELKYGDCQILGLRGWRA
jgi:hypothetical protein